MSDNAAIGILTGTALTRGAPGGVHAYVLGLARYLRSKDRRVTLFTNGPVDDAPPGVRVVAVSERHLPSTVQFQRALGEWVRRDGFEGLSVLHTQRPDMAWPIRRLRHLPPLICTLHGNPRRGVRRRRGPLLGFAYRMIEGRSIGLYRVIIAVDNRTAASYRQWYPHVADRICVIPNAVATPSASPNSFKSVPREGPPTFLFVGRLSPEKRVERIIDALRSPRLRGARLLIVGSGPEEHRLRARVDGLSVTFLGRIARDAMEGLYGEATALVLASEFEGLPTVALEALSFGCPVVAPRGCGLDGVLDSVSGVQIDGVEELPQGMEAAIRLRHSGPQIRLRVEFTWDHVGPQIIEAYREAMSEGPA